MIPNHARSNSSDTAIQPSITGVLRRPTLIRASKTANENDLPALKTRVSFRMNTITKG